MNFVKCIPFVGTAVTGYESGNALLHGDFKGFICKGVETVIDGALDVTIVMSGGLSGLVTAPIKTAAKKGGILAGSATIKAVAGRAFAGAVVDHINPARDNSRHYSPLFEQSQRGSNEERRSQPQRQRSQTNSNDNTRSTTSEKKHSDSSGATSGSAGGDDPSQRRNRIKMTCQQPIRLLRPRYYQKKAVDTFPKEFDKKNVATVEEANQCLVERMLHYVEVMHHRAFGNVPVPENAIRNIFKVVQESSALNRFYELNRDNMVVQIDEIFFGVKADGSNWSVTFTIDADIPPPGSRQPPHFGITIERENASFRTLNHADVIATIPYGRPRPGQNASLTDVFVVKESVINIDGGTFKHQVKVTMLKRKPSPF